MALAAGANDRASIIYMAKAYQTGVGLGTTRYDSLIDLTCCSTSEWLRSND